MLEVMSSLAKDYLMEERFDEAGSLLHRVMDLHIQLREKPSVQLLDTYKLILTLLRIVGLKL